MLNERENLLSKTEMQEILDALELPAEAVPLFLQHITDFCQRHGSEKYYAELLKLAQTYSKVSLTLI
jgi:hypothetical protein